METKVIDPLHKKLVELLGTSTGAALCDSGGAYGRHWERNKKFLEAGGNFEDLPRVSVHINGSDDEDLKEENDMSNKTFEVEVSINIYHFLYESLLYNDDCAQFNKFLHEYEGDLDDLFKKDIDILKKKLKEIFDTEDFDLSKEAVNTYNGEDALSQTLWYRRIDIGLTQYVFIMIHQGCDVRGGYTWPQLFEVSADERLHDNNIVNMACGCENWTSWSAGYRWESQGTDPEGMLHPDQMRMEGVPLPSLEMLNDFTSFPYERFKVVVGMTDGKVDTSKSKVYCRRCGKELTFSF